jgi:hypothetical protein
MKHVLILLCLVLGTAAHAATDAQALLAESDRARGGHLPGLSWTIQISSVDGDGQTVQTMAVIAQDADSRADYTAPAKLKGQFVVMLGRNMWFARWGLQKPVPISPRQRLIGQAANGDIAATNYLDDYNASLAGEDTVDGEQCVILQLVAKTKSVTYDRIRYWVSSTRKVGVKAEFFTVSGRLFKSARFEYGNTIGHEGRTYPFISRMQIVDAINAQNRTTMDYSRVAVCRPDPSRFELVQ